MKAHDKILADWKGSQAQKEALAWRLQKNLPTHKDIFKKALQKKEKVKQ